MKNKRHVLNDVWEQYPTILPNHYQATNTPDVEDILTGHFTIGECYFYIIDITNSSLSNFHERVLSIHGLKNYPEHLKEIIDLVHPDDIPFVIAAESWSLLKMKEIGFEHQLNLKTGYCFRMKTANDTYELFHHQAIHMLKDENGALVRSMNIHTNIDHITQQNNFIVTVSGIGGRNDFHQYHHKPEVLLKPIGKLTKRESELLPLISRGMSSIAIAQKLGVSHETVRIHRKNILKKTDSKNSSELIRKSLEWGYV